MLTRGPRGPAGATTQGRLGPRGQGSGLAHLHLGARRPPAQAAPAQRWGRGRDPCFTDAELGPSCGSSRPRPTLSGPGWTEDEGPLVASRLSAQGQRLLQPVPGRPSAWNIGCRQVAGTFRSCGYSVARSALQTPKSPAGTPPGSPRWAQNCHQRHTRPGPGHSWGQDPAGSAWPVCLGSLTAPDGGLQDCPLSGRYGGPRHGPQGPAQPAPAGRCLSGLEEWDTGRAQPGATGDLPATDLPFHRASQQEPG